MTCVQYTPFVARYREIMAEQLVQNPDNMTKTGNLGAVLFY